MVFAVIDICITWTLYSGKLSLAEITAKVMKIGFFMFFILNMDKINQAILVSFQYAGLTAAQVPATELLKPSAIIDQGFRACGAILEYMMNNKLSLLGPGLAMYLIYIIVTLAAFFFMAFQILITKIEFNVFASLAVILLPFGSLKYTQFLFQRVISAVFSYGVKLMVMIFILGLFKVLLDSAGGGIPGWTPEDEPSFGDTLRYALSYATMAFLMWQLPNLAAGFMNGQPSLEGGQALGGLKAGAAMAASVASAPMTAGASVAAAAGAIGATAHMAKAASATSGKSFAREFVSSAARQSFANSKIGQALIKGATRSMNAAEDAKNIASGEVFRTPQGNRN